MIRKLATGATLAVLAAMAIQPAARADAAPFEVLPTDPVANFTEFKSLPADATQQVPITGNPDFTKALEIAVPNAPQSPGLDGEYEITLGVPTAATVTEGDALVATLWARSIEPTSGRHDRQRHVVFETDGSPFKKSLNAALLYGTDWQKFQFPFRAAVTYTAGTATAAHLNLWLGYGAQKFQIAGVSVQDYGPGNPAGYPQVTYDGRDANAAWRTAANARIDQYRKGNLAVSVVDPAGNPISGATVSAVQQTSAFKFGAASDGARLIGDPSGGISGTDLQQYQSKASTLFNQGALGNNLKWNHWENQTERDTITLPALQWMRQHGLRIRGHNLIWPSWGLMQPDLVTLQNDPAALRARINTHITDEASALAGIVDEWDVVNEPYSEHNVQDILGPNEIASWFQLAHQADPNAKLVLNDYGLVENNGWEKRHRDSRLRHRAVAEVLRCTDRRGRLREPLQRAAADLARRPDGDRRPVRRTRREGRGHGVRRRHRRSATAGGLHPRLHDRDVLEPERQPDQQLRHLGEQHLQPARRALQRGLVAKPERPGLGRPDQAPVAHQRLRLDDIQPEPSVRAASSVTTW